MKYTIIKQGAVLSVREIELQFHEDICTRSMKLPLAARKENG